MSLNVSECLQMSPNVSIETFKRHFRDISPYRLHQSLIPNVLPALLGPAAAMMMAMKWMAAAVIEAPGNSPFDLFIFKSTLIHILLVLHNLPCYCY